MALTNFGLLNTNQKTSWAMDTWSQARVNSFMNRFVGTGPLSMIQHITELTKTQKGTRAIMTLVADMLTDGITGDNTLEGNEEALQAFDHEIKIDQLRNANRLAGRIADQKVIVNFRKESKDKLAYWLADRLDQMAFLSLSSIPYTKTNSGGLRSTTAGQRLYELEFAPDSNAAPTTNRGFHLKSTGITAGTGYDATDGSLVPMSYKSIVELKALAKDMRIPSLRGDGGSEFYHVFVTPKGMAELKLDADFIANVRHAGIRGDKNSLFKGTSDSVMVDGLMIHEHHHVYNTRNGATGTRFGTTNGNDHGQRVLLCGAQSLGFADLGPGFWVEDDFDYGNQIGISYGKIFGFTKPQFKGNLYDFNTNDDFSVICLDTAMTPS